MQQVVDIERMRKLAWGLLLGGFVTFIALVVGGAWGTYSFLFDSIKPIYVRLDVARGTAIVTSVDLAERGVRRSEELTGRVATVSLDAQSQAVFTFQEVNANGQPDRVIMTATLKSNSDIRLRQATMPRFTWGRGGYTIVLREFAGSMDVFVAENLAHRIAFEVETRRGETIHIERSGRYVLESLENRTRVITRTGEAVLFAKDKQKNRIVPNQWEAVLFPERDEPIALETRPNLLENGLFAFGKAAQSNGQMLPERWGCTVAQDAPPRGVYRMDYWQGRAALRLLRGDGAETHGETRCVQFFGEAGFDVGDFSFLELRTTFLINYQSLSDCGIRGSECPMMLRMAYRDINGTMQEYIQGFYYESNPALGYPPRCDTCIQDHREINEQVWYTFETGNLMTLISSSVRPAQILSVEFYASGHQYDLFVSEIGLYAGHTDAVPEVQPPSS